MHLRCDGLLNTRYEGKGSETLYERCFAQHDVTAHLTKAGGREVLVLPHGQSLFTLGLVRPIVQVACTLASYFFMPKSAAEVLFSFLECLSARNRQTHAPKS